ncbi:hypothetical protein B0H14DRAFT_3440259 [Mycena olivaceomarginata]|nr:hypothetical protein B0H14DRAFT_3440259 [Mycena olivaceomarginata]
MRTRRTSPAPPPPAAPVLAYAPPDAGDARTARHHLLPPFLAYPQLHPQPYLHPNDAHGRARRYRYGYGYGPHTTTASTTARVAATGTGVFDGGVGGAQDLRHDTPASAPHEGGGAICAGTPPRQRRVVLETTMKLAEMGDGQIESGVDFRDSPVPASSPSPPATPFAALCKDPYTPLSPGARYLQLPDALGVTFSISASLALTTPACLLLPRRKAGQRRFLLASRSLHRSMSWHYDILLFPAY